MSIHRCFPGDSDSKESACNAGDPALIPGSGRSLEKGMVTHSSILAWQIPWTEEPGGLQSGVTKESDTIEHTPIDILTSVWKIGPST